MRLALRPAADGDRALLEEICLRAGREMMTVARGGWFEEREREQFRRHLDIAATSIAQCDGRDVGFMMVVMRGEVRELHSLYVLPEWQGRGIGTWLTREVIATAAPAGQAVELSVIRANHRARALYERLGFRMISETASHHRLRFMGASGEGSDES